MYKFKIGERLFPARSVDLNVSAGAYVVIKRLPMRDGEFEYQIRSLAELRRARCAGESIAIKSRWKQAWLTGRILAGTQALKPDR